ncbi:MAG: ZPR1 zinc finger domain-containing protein [Methanoregula sp.]|nr:ZPR1 zinc finger domain-containing protein [Methanoregula sp.]
MRTVIPGPCPSCSNEIEYRYQTEDIPYFSEILIVSANCPSCGYRYVDTQLLRDAEPSRYEFSVSAAEDLAVRVVRSMSGTVRIPELGVEIEPGPACDGFVTNVEGVLNRIENVVEGALLWAEGGEREHAGRLLELIARARAGTLPFTLILDDPRGNSAIVSEKAHKKPLDAGTEHC